MKFGVSLYSYMVAYEKGQMDLEACLKEMKSLPGSVDGVEILADRKKIIPQRSYIGTLSEADQDQWKELIAKYDMKPTCYDSCVYDEVEGFDFRKFQRLINPSKDHYNKQMALLKNEIDFCADLGFPIMRGPNLFGFYEEVIRDSLKYANEKNVKICMEVHAPLTIKGDYVNSYAEMVDKTCPDAGGFIPDFGIFAKSLPRPLIRKTLADGGDPELVKHIDSTYDSHGDMSALAAEIKAKTTNEAVLTLMDRAYFYKSNKPEDLKSIAHLIRHIHAKFYEVDENYVEHGIDFEGPLKALKEIGFTGYISSEYEGQRMLAPEELDEKEQVRRQIVMTQKILANL